MADGMGHIDGDNRIAMQSDHHAEASGGNQIDGGYAEAGSQDAVERRWRTSALNVAEDADAHILI